MDTELTERFTTDGQDPKDFEQDIIRNIRNAALMLLSRREHSSYELQQKLSKKDFEPRLICAVLAELEVDGYLSDKRFAEAYTRSRIRKGFGWQRIRLELKEKGIAPDLVADVESMFAEDGEGGIDTIYRVWKKKYAEAPEDLKSKAKQQKFLMYRGFNSEEIRALFQYLSQS